MALKQVEEVKRLLDGRGCDFEVVSTLSFGDRHKEISLMDSRLASDFFTLELDNALLDGTADIAVHSAKDLPYPLPGGIELLALTQATDNSDSLVARDGLTLQALPVGSKVGTSSAGRKAELQALRPDLIVVPIRGTIEERIAQVDNGQIDALIVATCALDRLGLRGLASETLPFKTHPLQGHLAVTAAQGSTLVNLFRSIDIRRGFGKVTLVGFGPGAPDLLTIRARKKLEEAHIIYYDDLTNEAFLEAFDCRKVYVGKRCGKHSHDQDEINELIYRSAVAGLRTVRLKGGDPMVFGHAREEIDYLKSRMVDVEVVPGISSASAMSALTQIPLTHRGMAQSVAFVLGHTNQPQTPAADTLVYYMGGGNISTIARRLLDAGRRPNTPVALVSNVSLPGERVVLSTLNELRWATYRVTPVMIVIGSVVEFYGKNKGQTYNTGTQGETPLIEITPSNIAQPQAQAFDWVVFTSRYGVRYYTEPLDGTRIASVGSVTTAEIAGRGYEVTFESPTQSAKGLIDFFVRQPPQKILLPRSDKGLKTLSEALEKQGHRVTDLAVYTNTPNPKAIKQDLTAYDRVLFTSPTTVEVFRQLYADAETNHLLLIAKGETTYEAIQTL